MELDEGWRKPTRFWGVKSWDILGGDLLFGVQS